MQNKKNCDYLIIGAGIIGLSTAYQLQKATKSKVILIDKENQIAKHQSSHNSGVIHAGVYYKPESLKSKLCKDGVESTINFCNKYNIKYQNIGKLLVATDDNELARMDSLFQRAQSNNISVEKVDEATIKKLEPNITGLGAIYSPTTSIVDFAEISSKIAELFLEGGGEILLNESFISARENNSEVITITTNYNITSEKIISCAGLMSDVIAQKMGANVDYKIIPFRGEFFKIKNQSYDLVNHLIYPIPDPSRPFLGIHITKKINGTFTVGPNAVLATSREGYNLSDINFKYLTEITMFPGFWKMLKNNLNPAITELTSSLSKNIYLKRIQKYCPQIQLDDLSYYPAGVRAQAVDKSGKLIDDFLFIKTSRSLHVCNAPSPAATAAFPIGKHIVNKILS